jgi:hypothetical protein
MKMKSVKSFIAGVIIGSALYGGIGFAASQVDTFEVSFNPVKFFFNGEEVKTDREFYFHNGSQYVPASFSYKGTTYVPARYLSETIGKQVTWDQQTRAILISDPETVEQTGEGQTEAGRNKSAASENSASQYIVSNLEQVPTEIKDWVETQRKAEFKGVKQADGKAYVLITRGEQAHGGYGIDVYHVAEQDGKLLIEAKYTEPDPDMVYAMVITYPFVLLEFDTNLEIEISVEGSSGSASEAAM